MWNLVEPSDGTPTAVMAGYEATAVLVYANQMDLGIEPDPGDMHTTPEVAVRRHDAAIFCAEIIRAGGCPLYAYREMWPGGPKSIKRKNNGGNGEARLSIVR
jgi:hypothetical protein